MKVKLQLSASRLTVEAEITYGRMTDTITIDSLLGTHAITGQSGAELYQVLGAIIHERNKSTRS